MSTVQSIRFGCPQCNKQLQVAANTAGKRIQCPNCSNIAEVPAPSDTPMETGGRARVPASRNGEQQRNAQPVHPSRERSFAVEEMSFGKPILSDLRWVTPILSYISIVLIGLLIWTLVIGVVLLIIGWMTWLIFFFLFVGVVVLCASWFMAYFWWFRGRMEACEKGLIIHDCWGNETRMAYDDITEIRSPAKLSVGSDLLNESVLVTRDGEEFQLVKCEPETLEVLKPVLLEKIACRIGNEQLARIQRGENVKFGDMVVNHQGISLGKVSLHWSDIRYAVFDEQGLRLILKDSSPMKLVLPLDTPNIHAFLHVLWEMQQSIEGHEGQQHTKSDTMKSDDIYAFMNDQTDEDGRPLRQSSFGRSASSFSAPRKPPRIPGFPRKDPDLGHILYGMPPKKILFWGAIGAYVVIGLLTVVCFTLAAWGSPGWLALWFISLVALGAWAKPILENSRTFGFAVYEGGIRKGRRRMRWNECVRFYLVLNNVFYEGADMDDDNNALKESTMQIDSHRSYLLLNFVDQVGRNAALKIVDSALPVLVQRYLEYIVKWGGDFTVGGLTLRRDAVVFSGMEYPLHRIKKYALQAGKFSFKARGLGDAIYLPATAWNFPVFYALFKILVAEAQQEISA